MSMSMRSSVFLFPLNLLNEIVGRKVPPLVTKVSPLRLGAFLILQSFSHSLYSSLLRKYTLENSRFMIDCRLRYFPERALVYKIIYRDGHTCYSLSKVTPG